MKKEILEEVNRFREIMSLKPLNMINEVGGVGAAVKMSLKQIYKAFGKEVVENAIKEEVEVYAKNFAKQVKQGKLLDSIILSDSSMAEKNDF